MSFAQFRQGGFHTPPIFLKWQNDLTTLYTTPPSASIVGVSLGLATTQQSL